MPSTTSDQQLILPSNADVNDVVTETSNLILGSSNNGVESRLVKRYASAADRTARNPAPNEGELSYLFDLNEIDVYDGTGWQFVWSSAFSSTTSLFARKTGDQTITSSTTLTNDTQLALSGMAANGIYNIEGFMLIRATNASNGGMKTTFTLPAGADFSNCIFELALSSRGPAASGTVSGITLTASNAILTFRGLLLMGGSAGTFQFQWAQNASNANGSIVGANSFLWMYRVA